MTLRHHGALLSNTLLISNTSVAANVSGKLSPLAQSPLIPLIGMVAHCWHQLSVSFCERLFMVWTNNWDKWQLRTQSWWYTLILPQHTQPRKDQIRSVSWLIILHLNFLQTSQSRQLLWHCHASEGQMVDLYFCLKLFSHSREYNIHQNLAN